MSSRLEIVCAAMTGTSSILSIAGAIGIFIAHGQMAVTRGSNFTRRLLLYLTVADLITSSGNLVASIAYAVQLPGYQDSQFTFSGNCSLAISNDTQHYLLCESQSFATTYSNMVSFLWTLVISVHICCSVVIHSTRTEMFGMHALYVVICFCVPFGLTWYALTEGVLGQDHCYGTGIWCGINTSGRSREEIAKWMYLVDVAWQLFSYVVSLAMYMLTEVYIRQYYRDIPLNVISSNLRNQDKSFMFALLIVYCLKVWGIMRFFINTYTDSSIISSNTQLQSFLDFLLIADSFGVSGQAFFNFILFCYHDKEVWHQLRRRFCREDKHAVTGDWSDSCDNIGTFRRFP